MIEKLTKASPGELQLWMISAAVFGFSLGVYISDYVYKKYALFIMIISLLVHMYMMYWIYSRK